MRTDERTPYQLASELVSHLPGEIYEGMEAAFDNFVSGLAAALTSERAKALEEAAQVADEFDGTHSIAAAIRRLIPQDEAEETK